MDLFLACVKLNLICSSPFVQLFLTCRCFGYQVTVQVTAQVTALPSRANPCFGHRLRINLCVVVATQCMHGSVSLAACCAFVRPPLFWRRFRLLIRGAKAYPTVVGVTAIRSIVSFDTVSLVPSNPAAAQNYRNNRRTVQFATRTPTQRRRVDGSP